jgi:hypothetical protein
VEGSLSTIPLTDVLEMVHSTRGTGTLRLESEKLPLEIQLSGGDVIGGSILDWEGLEAIVTFPLHTSTGRFQFATNGRLSGSPLMSFKSFVGEWARMNDQWARFREIIDSPSRVLETPRPTEPYAVFFGGRSIRSAAKAWNVPLIIAAERAWRGVREGDLIALHKYAWYPLRIRHPLARRTQMGIQNPDDLMMSMDGSRNLGELIQGGISIASVRKYLIDRIGMGDLSVPGSGWILRDLLWEIEALNK